MGLFKKTVEKDKCLKDIPQVSAIDLDPLISDLSPEHPSGEKDFEYHPDFLELQEKIKGIPEVVVGDQVVQEAKGPNWSEIQSAAIDLLNQTHDLRIAVCLTRALPHTNGLVGIRDGLRLIKHLLKQFWPTLYPQLDPEENNDPTQRINILMALNDYETALSPLMRVPLCNSKRLGTYSLRDIHTATGKLAVSSNKDIQGLSMDTIEAAFKDSDDDTLVISAAAVRESLQNIGSIEDFLLEKVATGGAPNFEELRQILQEIENILFQHLPKRRSSRVLKSGEKKETKQPKDDEKVNSPQVDTDRGNIKMDTISNRQDVTRILDQICYYYEKNEPASPVPLLLKRARRLVEKNFFEIIEDVAPESVDQIQKLIGESKE